MINTRQENLFYLSSTFSKLLKRRFGKGPETCYFISKNSRLYVFMRSFMTPAEEVLADKKELNLAIHFRSTVINAVTKEFLPEIVKVLGGKYESFYQDWNYDTNTGIILIEDTTVSNYESRINLTYESELFHLVEQVSSTYHKRPSHLEIVKFTQNICAVEAKGCLLPLESLIHKTGSRDLLYHREREIKNGYLKHKDLFEDIFNRLIEDMFIMWDYENDRNYLIFNFNKDYSIN